MIGVLNLGMFLLQPALIFYPDKTLVTTPADWGMAYEEVTMMTADKLQLHGWYLPHPTSRRVLLFLHGNAGNISQRRQSLQIFHNLGLSVLIIDYRGYGNSAGTPSEAGLYQDAQTAWDYLTQQRGFTPAQVVVFGRSLGAAVAAQLATRVQPAGLILESTFSNARAMASRLFPGIVRIIWLRYEFDTLARMQHIHCPLLVLHSPADDIIPYRFGQQIFAAANEPKMFYAMQGDHNSGFLESQPAYSQALREFLAKL